MAIRIKNQYFTFGKVLETTPKSVKATLSSSEKNKEGKREYSDWIVVFAGAKAVEAVSDLKKGDFICVSGKIKRVGYVKVGETKKSWGDAQILIFDWNKWEKKDVSNGEELLGEEPPEDEIPF